MHGQYLIFLVWLNENSMWLLYFLLLEHIEMPVYKNFFRRGVVTGLLNHPDYTPAFYTSYAAAITMAW
jgi:hypothetical protein